MLLGGLRGREQRCDLMGARNYRLPVFSYVTTIRSVYVIWTRKSAGIEYMNFSSASD